MQNTLSLKRNISVDSLSLYYKRQHLQYVLLYVLQKLFTVISNVFAQDSHIK